MTWSEPAAWSPVAEAVLERLSADADHWMVLKHHERLPEVTGDIDLCVPRAEWDKTLEVIRAELGELGDFAITYCEHWPHARLMFIAPRHVGDEPMRILQIDLIDGVLWRGMQLAPAAALLSDHQTVSDAGGVRLPHSSSGLRAALFLTAYGIEGSGRLSGAVIEAKAVGALAREDPDGFITAMRKCHGRVGTLAARRFLADRWSRHQGLVLHTRRLLRRPVEHFRLARAAVERRRRGHWRRLSRDLPGGLPEWLSVHAGGHPVTLTGSPGHARGPVDVRTEWTGPARRA